MKLSTNKIIVFLFLVIGLLAYTTKVEAQKMEAGLRFMPTISSFSMKNAPGRTVTGEAMIGFGVGGFFGYNFNEHVGIQVELIYSTLSQRYVETDISQEINLGYVNIPLLFSYNTSKSESVNFNFVLGPQLGISAASNIFTERIVGNNHAKGFLKVKSSDIGLAYGAGIDFGLNSSNTLRLSGGFRGVYGLLDISDNSETLISGSYYILDKTSLVTYSVYLGLSMMF
jgi:hypothetical protein